MNIISDQTVTAKLDIVDLLKGTGLSDAFDVAIANALNARNLNQSKEAIAFICAKLDELTEYVDANRNQDGTTAAELKTLIEGWIVKQGGA